MLYSSLNVREGTGMRIPILVALLLPMPAAAQDKSKLETRKDWATSFSTAHYEVRSTCTPQQVKPLADHMELVFDTYVKLFSLRQAPTKKSLLVLFKDEKEYLEQPGTPQTSVAYYDPNNKALVGYLEPKRMYNTFAHEGTHQFTDIALKDIDRAPPWFAEGLAECIGNSVVQKGKLFMCARNGVIAQDNLPVVQEMIRNKTHVPLRELVGMNQARWDQTPGMYPQAWSFCTFLLAYPKYEETKSQIPNGKYWSVLSTYIKMMSDRRIQPEAAMKASFQLGGKPLDLDQLEKEWIEYVLKMENSGTFAEKDLQAGLLKARITETLAATVFYPAKEKGEKAPVEASGAPYPVVVISSDEAGLPLEVAEWLGRGFARYGFVAIALEGPEETLDARVANLAAAREWVAKCNAGQEPLLKGALNGTKIVAAGHGKGAQAALLAAQQAGKFAGCMVFSPGVPEKAVDRLKVPALVVTGEQDAEEGAKLYGLLKKPRYYIACSGINRSFEPAEKGTLVLEIAGVWLSYRFADQVEWGTYLKGDEARKRKEKGAYKDFRIEE